MADRSQHPGQIMETQTRYNLNAAIENWRAEISAQPNLTVDARRELETHLRDAIAGFQQRGLNDEESFWLACKRVGQPPHLGEEFVKANPAAVWRERIFWMVFGCLGFALWESLVSCIQLHHWLNNGFLGLLSIYSLVLFYYLPPVTVAIILAKGYFNRSYSPMAVIIQSRWLLATSVIVFIAATHGVQAINEYRFLIQTDGGLLRPHTLDGFWVNTFSSVSWPLMLVLLAAWLMPSQNRKSPNCRAA
jgi:hypothetical protein